MFCKGNCRLQKREKVDLCSCAGGRSGHERCKNKLSFQLMKNNSIFSCFKHARRRSIKNVRVIVKGLGNGRMVRLAQTSEQTFPDIVFKKWPIFKASIKALQMGKLNIVSVTDRTVIPVPFLRAPKPPAKRRL